jgi:hypothetical protein
VRIEDEAQAKARASQLLGVPSYALRVIHLPEERVWEAVECIRGGYWILMDADDDRQVMCVGSALSEKAALEEWRGGLRHSVDDFGPLRERRSAEWAEREARGFGPEFFRTRPVDPVRIEDEACARARASELSGIPAEVFDIARLPKDHVWRAAEPISGGDRLFMDDEDGSALLVNSGLSEEKILEAWRRGRRLELYRFGPGRGRERKAAEWARRIENGLWP